MTLYNTESLTVQYGEPDLQVSSRGEKEHEAFFPHHILQIHSNQITGKNDQILATSATSAILSKVGDENEAMPHTHVYTTNLRWPSAKNSAQCTMRY